MQTLLQLRQEHLFEDWDPPGSNDDLKRAFLAQAARLVATGLPDYIKRARKLLSDSQSGENPFDGWTPSVPAGVSLDPRDSEEFEELEAFGKGQVGRCGFVLVAGGLGERLGYNGIKVALPSQTLTGMCYLELYCRQIKSLQERYAGTLQLPFAIMTSDDTHARTEALLAANQYFGLEAQQVTLLKQEKVAALLDNDARIAKQSAYEIETKVRVRLSNRVRLTLPAAPRTRGRPPADALVAHRRALAEAGYQMGRVFPGHQRAVHDLTLRGPGRERAPRP